MRWLFPRLARFREQYPEVEVEISTGLEPFSRLPANLDVVIRREAEPTPGLYKRRVLNESFFPVCAPGLLQRLPLERITDLSRHTFLHCRARRSAWNDWLASVQHSRVVPAESLELEHLYFALQAALDGLGMTIGYSSLVASDIEDGRLLAPFGPLTVQSPGYFLIIREERRHDRLLKTFCDWLMVEGERFNKHMETLVPGG
jgi:LysR family glycine cleavage system transcriptional activator